MDFKDITSRNELADFLEISRKTLTYVLYKAHVESFYVSFDIPKKNGSMRHILAPTKQLKSIQRSLSDQLALYQKNVREKNKINNKISHAFETGKSIITNAQIHRNKRYIICLDLKDFFETIHFGRIMGYFEKNKFYNLPHEVALTIAQICCYSGYLPQGAPSSPIISNLIAGPLDAHLLKVAREYRLDYTRYADDLTFSTNSGAFIEQFDEFLGVVTREIELSGFQVNEAKTHIIYRDSRQLVTGLVVNKKINVPRSFYKDTRAMWHLYYTTGSFMIGEKEGTRNQLAGRFSFIDQLEYYNNRILLKEKKHNSHCLSGREKEYRNFLFYTRFLNNSKPVILTEGMTDILYIKAALKKLHKEYPSLVRIDEEGRFRFPITFFTKNHHWKYFFGMSMDGADAMKHIYSYFTGNGVDNLCSFFKDKGAITSVVPVVFLYDNEQETKRPLRTFINSARLDETQKNEFNKQNYTIVDNYSSLYLATVPLPAGKKECEIEDLFTQETLDMKIDGRSFSRKDEDRTKYYNKNIFSKYVYKHYQEIDFSGFRPLLDMLVEITKVKRESTDNAS